MKRYFKDCTTVDEAKNLFKALCFELHPDTATGENTAPEFARMFEEFKQFKPTNNTAEERTSFNGAEFYELIKNFDQLHSIKITFVGSFIWLEDAEDAEGATRAQKDIIKSILIPNFNKPRFSRNRLKWFYSPEGYKQKGRSKRSFNQLKSVYGSQSHTQQSRTQLN